MSQPAKVGVSRGAGPDDAEPLPAALADWLRFMAEIGYGELDLGLPRPAVAASGGPPAAAAARRRSLADAPAAVDARGSFERDGPVSAPPRRAPIAASATALFAPDAPLDPVLPLPERVEKLAAVAAEVAACTRCRLCEGRYKTVFGSGSAGARLMFIGEGPGADEDRQGLPFVGKAGELLTKIVGAMGLTRDQVYIANIVKCRPPGNRDPQPDEVAACRGYLERQLALIRPQVIVALGRIAAQTLLGTDQPIGRLRGSWYRLAGAELRATYHPAALLRNPDLKRPTWDDMQLVRDRLAELPAGDEAGSPPVDPVAPR